MTPDVGHETVGSRVKRLRLARGLSQRDLAAPGVSYAYISRIEAGARTPSVKALRQLAKRLGVSVEYLETGKDLREAEQRELRVADAELKLRLGGVGASLERELEEILAEARGAGDRAATVRVLFAFGLAASQANRPFDAIEKLETALGEDLVSPLGRPDVYATLAQAYVGVGAPDRAVRLLERCLQEVTRLAPDDAQAQVRFATYLSYALTDAGDYRRAAEVVTDALSRAPNDPDPYTRVRLYWSMSRLAGLEGRLAESLDYVRRAIALLETTEDRLTLARAHLLAANVELDQAHKASSREHVRSAERLLGSSPERLDLGMLRILQSQLERSPKRAIELAREAIAVLGVGHPAERGAASWALAGGLARQRKFEGAEDAYSAAADLLAIHGRRRDAAAACREWAEMLTAAGRSDEAAQILARAESLDLTYVS
jgi:transcriptional regulator with XRE-family HTH domain